MGLFSGETQVQVATNVSRVIADPLLPNSIKTGALKGILANGNIADYAMEEIIGSIALKAERFYAYAENDYVYGSPSGEFHSSIQGRTAVAAILDTIAGAPVLVDYSRFGPPNKLHIAYTKLVESYGYLPGTNLLGDLSTTKGYPVYLSNITIVIPAATVDSYEAGALDQWGYAASSGYKGAGSLSADARRLVKHTPIEASPTATEVQMRVDYEWLQPHVYIPGATTPGSGSFTVALPVFDGTTEYFHARYTLGADAFYWMYLIGSGTYPTLDVVFDGAAPVSGQFYPFVYFRHNKTAMTVENNPVAHASSKKLTKYIGIDFDAITEGIHESPDIADVEQAMMMLAVPAITTNQMEQRYLFDFFDTLYGESPEQFSSRGVASAYSALGALQGISKNAIIIKDALFKMALSNDGIYKRTIMGSLGKIGTCASGVANEIVYEDRRVYIVQGDYEIQSVPVAQTYHYYRKQVSLVSYQEVRILNLKTVFYIYGQYTAIGDGTDSILLIPLDRSITKTYQMSEREELYSRSLHYVFNSAVITELAWYQSDFFQFLIIAISIIITVATMDPEILMMSIALNSGTMSLLSFIWTMASTYLIPYLVSTLAFKFFVKAVGTDIAFLVAIVAAAYGTFKTFEFKSVAGAPWAKELLSISNGLVKAIGDSVEEALLGIKSDAEAFGLKLKEEYKLIEDASANLLEDTNRLASFVIFGEPPNDFFNRTIHSGNIGIRGIDAVSSYVSIALTLPKLSDSLGDSYGYV